MGNVAVADRRAGIDELDELYKLDASESKPEEEEAKGEEKEKEEGEEPEVMGHP